MSRRYDKETQTITPAGVGDLAEVLGSSTGGGEEASQMETAAETGSGVAAGVTTEGAIVADPSEAAGQPAAHTIDEATSDGAREPAADAAASAAGPNLFTVERVIGKPRVTALRVETSPRATIHAFDERAGRFNVDRLTAMAAVASGAFRVADDSQARLK